MSRSLQLRALRSVIPASPPRYHENMRIADSGETVQPHLVVSGSGYLQGPQNQDASNSCLPETGEG